MNINNITNAENYIIDAYKHCNIIGIGEGEHHLENSHQFFQRLFDNKQIQETVDIVIVEFANAGQQDILDKYIFGEEVDLNDLRKVWRESTQSINRFGEARIYFELLQKIRNVNFTLAPNKKIRVLGGDPPIDWAQVKSKDDYFKIGIQRDSFAANLAIEYGVKLSKKVLLIYAEYHLTKLTDESRLEMLAKFGGEYQDHLLTITNNVNNKYPDNMRMIAILDPAKYHLSEICNHWLLNSIINLESDGIGTLPAVNYFTEIFDNNEKVNLFEGYKVRDLFDAFLYIGPSETWQRVDYPKSVYSVEEWHELNRRRRMLGLESLDDSLK